MSLWWHDTNWFENCFHRLSYIVRYGMRQWGMCRWFVSRHTWGATFETHTQTHPCAHSHTHIYEALSQHILYRDFVLYVHFVVLNNTTRPFSSSFSFSAQNTMCFLLLLYFPAPQHTGAGECWYTHSVRIHSAAARTNGKRRRETCNNNNNNNMMKKNTNNNNWENMKHDLKETWMNVSFRHIYYTYYYTYICGWWWGAALCICRKLLQSNRIACDLYPRFGRICAVCAFVFCVYAPRMSRIWQR